MEISQKLEKEIKLKAFIGDFRKAMVSATVDLHRSANRCSNTGTRNTIEFFACDRI